MRLIVCACWLLAALAVPTATAQPARQSEFKPEPESDFGPLALWMHDTQQATGLSNATAIAIVKDGHVVYEGYFGYADLKTRTPAHRDTLFYIASATKPFFALNALLEQNAGRLSMDMSLSQMFPDTRFQGFEPSTVTAGALLTHTSGLANPGLIWTSAYTGLATPKRLRALAAATRPDPETPPGGFRYSNLGYNLLSIWMDQQYAHPWQQELQRNVLAPLGMRHTTASIRQAKTAGWPLAQPYSLAHTPMDAPLALLKSDATMHAAGGLVSTAPDLARFLIAQMSNADIPGIPRAVIERSHQTQVSTSSQYLGFSRTGYAWGWYTGDYKGKAMLHHFGAYAGFHAHLSFMPDEGIGLVVLSNEDLLAPQLTRLIADYVYGRLLHETDIALKTERAFAELQGKAQSLEQSIVRQKAGIAARSSKLSLPLAAYTGRYQGEALGDVVVSQDNKSLRLTWGQLSAIATGGEQPDQIRIEIVPNSGSFLNFQIENGVVQSLSFEGMRFTR